MDILRHSKLLEVPQDYEIIKNTLYYISKGNNKFDLLLSDKDGTFLSKLNFDYTDLVNTPQLFSGNYNDLSNKPDLTVLNDTIILPLFSDLPTNGDDDKVYIISETGYMYRWNGNGYTQLTDQTAIWGQIGGSIENQPDLIDTFVNKSGDTMSGSLIIESDNKPSIKLEQNNSSYNGVLLSETGFGYLEIKPSNDKYGFLLRSFDSNDWFVGGVIGNNQNTFNSLLSGDGYNLARLGYHIYTGNNTDMPVMSFNVDKNVGIGTTTPTEKLDVEGSSVFRNGTKFLSIDTSSTSSLLDIKSSSSVQFDEDIYIFNQGSNRRFLVGDNASNGNWGGFRWQSDSKIVGFGHSGSGNGINDITVNSTGNVGIGVNNATEKLDVEGAVKATSFIGNGSGLTNLPKRQIKEITTATYTLLAEDIDKILHFNSATAQTVIVPNLLVVNISETRIEGKQLGLGEVSFVGDTGVNIRVSGNDLNTTGGQYSVFGLDKIADNEFVLFGKLKQ